MRGPLFYLKMKRLIAISIFLLFGRSKKLELIFDATYFKVSDFVIYGGKIILISHVFQDKCDHVSGTFASVRCRVRYFKHQNKFIKYITTF